MRWVMCKVLEEKKIGLPAPPFPGPEGQQVYEHVSEEAWKIWAQEQTRIINEHRLNMSIKKDRSWLFQVMLNFLLGPDRIENERSNDLEDPIQ